MQPMHLSEERLQRLLHQQLDASGLLEARDHVAACRECRERLLAAERDEAEVHALLRQLDHPPPETNAEEIAARAARTSPGWGRWAAGILLFLLGAGAAYAAPGSPLPGWIRGAVAWLEAPSRLEPPPPILDQKPEPSAGIAAPPGSDFTIAFTSPEPGGSARVSLTDGEEVVVRAPRASASFTSTAKGLVIANTGTAATFEIEIPRSAPRVEIRVGDRRILLKLGGRVVADAKQETGGHYTLALDLSAPIPDS
jgi:hypothetical protein